MPLVITDHDTNTNAAVTSVLPHKSGARVQLTKILLTFSPAPAAPVNIKIFDGDTGGSVLWDGDVMGLVDDWNPPLETSVNKDMTIQVAAGGSGVVTKLNVAGYSE